MNEKCSYCGENIPHGVGYSVYSGKHFLAFLHKKCAQYFFRQEARKQKYIEQNLEEENLGDA